MNKKKKMKKKNKKNKNKKKKKEKKQRKKQEAAAAAAAAEAEGCISLTEKTKANRHGLTELPGSVKQAEERRGEERRVGRGEVGDEKV